MQRYKWNSSASVDSVDVWNYVLDIEVGVGWKKISGWWWVWDRKTWSLTYK